MYKNPKKRKVNSNGDMESEKGKGASAMQPAASALNGTRVKLMKGIWEAQMNDGGFLKRRVEDVPVDQVCLVCVKSVGR